MRVLVGVSCAILLMLAVLGLALGSYIFVHLAAAQPRAGDAAVLAAAVAAAPVLILGAVSLGLVAVVVTIDHARAEQVALLSEQMRRDATPRDPALASRRARVAAEQEARIAAARGNLDA